MPQGLILGPRDHALLRLLDATPLTVALIRKISFTFDGEPFKDDRRVRERLQALGDAGLVRGFATASAGGGLTSYYRLTQEGYRMAFPGAPNGPPRASLQELAPSRARHSLATAEAIVHALVACRLANVTVRKLHGDGRLTLEIGEHRQAPDFHLQMESANRTFNCLFEIDNATEPLDSLREQSIRTKILGYETYQDWVLSAWKADRQRGHRPGFRVVFLTTGAERAAHILCLARDLARNPDRRLIYATTQNQFLGAERAVTDPLVNDHHGRWQALVDPQPTAVFLRAPIRIWRGFARPLAF